MTTAHSFDPGQFIGTDPIHSTSHNTPSSTQHDSSFDSVLESQFSQSQSPPSTESSHSQSHAQDSHADYSSSHHDSANHSRQDSDHAPSQESSKSTDSSPNDQANSEDTRSTSRSTDSHSHEQAALKRHPSATKSAHQWIENVELKNDTQKETSAPNLSAPQTDASHSITSNDTPSRMLDAYSQQRVQHVQSATNNEGQDQQIDTPIQQLAELKRSQPIQPDKKANHHNQADSPTSLGTKTEKPVFEKLPITPETNTNSAQNRSHSHLPSALNTEQTSNTHTQQTELLEGIKLDTSSDKPTLRSIQSQDSQQLQLDRGLEKNHATHSTQSRNYVAKQSIVNQFTDAVKAQINSTNTEMNIRLKPNHLGDIHMKIQINQASPKAAAMLSASIEVDNSAVKDMLQTNINQLKSSIEENNGLSIKRFEISVRQELPDQLDQQQQQQQDNQSKKRQVIVGQFGFESDNESASIDISSPALKVVNGHNWIA